MSLGAGGDDGGRRGGERGAAGSANAARDALAVPTPVGDAVPAAPSTDPAAPEAAARAAAPATARAAPRSPSLSALEPSVRLRLERGLPESLLIQLALTWTAACWALAECDVDEARWGDAAVEGIDAGELGWGVCLRRGPPGLRVDGDGIVEREMARRSARARALGAAAERLATPELCEVKAQVRDACGQAAAAALGEAEEALLEALTEALRDEEAFRAASPEDPRAAAQRALNDAFAGVAADSHVAPSHANVRPFASGSAAPELAPETACSTAVASTAGLAAGSVQRDDALGTGAAVRGPTSAAVQAPHGGALAAEAASRDGPREADPLPHGVASASRSAPQTALDRVLRLALEEAGAEVYAAGSHPPAAARWGAPNAVPSGALAAAAETYFRGVVVVPLLVALRGSEPKTLRASTAAFGRAGRAVAGDLASVAAASAGKDLQGALDRCLLGCDAWTRAVESERARWGWAAKKRGRRPAAAALPSAASGATGCSGGVLAGSAIASDPLAWRVQSGVADAVLSAHASASCRDESQPLGSPARSSLGLCFCPAACDAALAAPKRLRRRCAELARALASVRAAEAAVEALARAAPAPARAAALERCRRALEDVRVAARKGPFLNVGEALDAAVDPHRVEGGGDCDGRPESAVWGPTWGSIWRDARGDAARLSAATVPFQKPFQSDFPSSTTRYPDEDAFSVALTRRTQAGLPPSAARSGAAAVGADGAPVSATRYDPFPQGLVAFEGVLKASCREIAAAIGPVLAACPDADAARHLARRLGAAKRLPGIDAVIESIREGRDEDGGGAAGAGAGGAGGSGSAALAAALRAAERDGGGQAVALQIRLASITQALHSYGGAWQLQRQVAEAQAAQALLSSLPAVEATKARGGADADAASAKGATKPSAAAARIHASLAASHPGPAPSAPSAPSPFSFASSSSPHPARAGRAPPQPVFWRPPGTEALLPSIPAALWSACAFGDAGGAGGGAGAGGRRVPGSLPLPSALAQSVSPARLAELADLYARAARVALAVERAGPPVDPAQAAAREAALARGLWGGVTWEGAPQTILAYLTGIEEALR